MREKKRSLRKGSITHINHPIIQKKINESLKLSVKEGSVSAVSSGFGLSYLSPFALALNATASQMGILHAIISLLPSLVQLKAITLIKKFSRKKIIITGLITKMILWIPIIITGILFYLGTPNMAWILIGLIGLFYAASAVIHPVWFSWMGSLVPDNGRGKYFSKRNIAAGFFGVVTMLIAAVILDGMKKIGTYTNNEPLFTILGFSVLFTLAIFAQGWSCKLLKRQYEPRLKLRKKDYFTFKQFLKKCTSTSFGKFTIFRFIFSFSVAIASPFFALYMLRDLGMSYIWYMGITISTILFRLIFLPTIGKFSDRFGNIKLLKICSIMGASMPLLYLLSSFIPNDLANKQYLHHIPVMICGLGWGGFDLAVNNYVYDAVSSPKRSFGLSYMNLMIGVGSFIGAGAGSLLALLNIASVNIILLIFGISATLRLLVAIFGVRLLHEVRHVKKFSYEFLIREFQPMQGIVHEIHNLEHMVKKNEHYI